MKTNLIVVIAALLMSGCAVTSPHADTPTVVTAAPTATPPVDIQAVVNESRMRARETMRQVEADLEQAKQARAAEAERRRTSYIAAHPDLAEATRDAIQKGNLMIGMTRDEFRASWGEPARINRDVSATTEREQWVYDRSYEERTYVYFVNDRLTSYQH